MTPPQKTIYYDGNCALCTEAARRVDASSPGTFVCLDVHSHPLPNHISKDAALRDVHIVDESGTYKGWDAVLYAASISTGMRWIQSLGKLPLVYQVGKGMYRIVARYRTILQRK